MSMLSELELGLAGLAQLQALLASGRQPPIHETLGIALVSAEKGFVTVEAHPSGGHLNPAGIVQGGYLAVVLDTACGCAVHSALPAGASYMTLELKTSFHRAVTADTGRIKAEGRILSVSRRAAFSEAKLLDAAGRLLASATSSLIILQHGGDRA